MEPELDAVAQFKRFESLCKFNIDHVESHVALAEAALAAKLWGQARAHLEKVSESGITPRLCRLMATLEEAQFQDRDKAQHWLAQTAMAEPDMAWLCGSCGVESAFWSARCGKCGVFNGIAWEKPLRVARISRVKNDDSFEDLPV
ncbi:MAG: hypothetical protein ACJ0HN_02450 [Alphaproteobacteria bacterium]